jgi:heterodisulfide reductase subunit B
MIKQIKDNIKKRRKKCKIIIKLFIREKVDNYKISCKFIHIKFQNSQIRIQKFTIQKYDKQYMHIFNF